MDKLAVVILNFNGKRFLEQFLPSVIQHSPEATIYVADNASTDDSLEFMAKHYPTIKLIINSENGGFAKGYNDALKSVVAEYYVLLNSDIEVTENWLNPCVELLESNSKIVAVQPKILSFHNKTHFEHAGAAGGFLDKDFYPFCQGRLFETVEEDLGQYDLTREVFWATGACLFIRSEKYHEVGGLDEDFFAHMEEIDLCWRLKARENQIYYCAESMIYHVGGGTLSYQNPRKTYLNFRNSLFMLTKNHQGNLFLKLFKRLLLDGLAATLFIVKFQFRHVAAVFNAHMSFYKRFRTFLVKRKLEKHALGVKRKNVKLGLYKGSIVFSHFLFGKKKFSDLDVRKFVDK